MIKKFIETYGYNHCSDSNCRENHLRTEAQAALDELASLQKQIEQARLEGARVAFHIALDEAFGDCHTDEIDWSIAIRAYKKEFGEEAPQ